MHSARLLIAGVLTIGTLTGMTGIVSCSSAPGRSAQTGASAQWDRTNAIDPTNPAALDSLLDQVNGGRVVYIGEIHDRYDHHQNQLAVIRGLNERGLKLAIGMEYFQEPSQRYLDAYVAGDMNEKEMLRKTEYFSRWRFDYRLYRDILEYARKHDIPLVALNAPTEMVEAVSKGGVESLSPSYRGRLPAQIEPADADYEARLRNAFRMHGDLPEERFQRFMEVQSVWDEYMARRAADYLSKHHDRTLVVLVGAAHVLHDAAIPKRLRRYQPVEQTVIVTKPFEPLPGVEPDIVLSARELALPAPGRLGMSMRGGPDGVSVQSITPDGAAQKAGLKVGDQILQIAGDRVASLEEVRVAMMDSSPGDRVRVVTERGSGPSPERMTKVLTLM